MDEAKSVTATFTQDSYALTVNVVGQGSVDLDPSDGPYLSGTAVELTAVADAGWTFSGWSGDLDGSTNPASITMDGAKSVTATFTQDSYVLTVNVVGQGSVDLDPAGGTYLSGTTVELTAVADAGWTFSGWSGDLGGSTNPESITMDGAKSVTATFTQDSYVLTVNVVGQGSVDLDPSGGTYLSGTTVELTAVADTGWSFSGWSGDLGGSTNPESITMDGAKSVTATFTQDSYVLTVNVVGQGSVDLDPTGGTYLSGTTVELTAVADAGWTFSGWSGDLGGSTNPESITMDEAKSVTATFAQDSYVLTVNVVGQGSVELDPAGGTYLSGTTVELTAVADAGWTFSEWSGDLGGSTNPESITMDGAKSVTATFTQDSYVLTVNVVGQGSVDLDPAGGTYLSGTTVELTAVADAGWTFSGWSGDLGGSTNPESITMDEAKSVTATFTQDLYTLSTAVIGDGSITLNPDGGVYQSGSEVELTAVADAGWTFIEWSGDLTGSENPESITMDGNKSVTATFADITPPETTITSAPSDPTNTAAASFEFESSEAGSSFECSLDEAEFGACASPQAYGGLSDGAHTFRVRATDGAGNTDETPASHTWIIDTLAPETTITSAPSDPTNNTAASFEFESSEAGSGFECSLDAAEFDTCTSPHGYSGLSDGAHTFLVRATDGLGNMDQSPASHTWNIDTTAPETTITEMPDDPSNSEDGHFSFSSDDPAATFECSLDSAEYAACTVPYEYSGLSDGPHTFAVRAIDALGNTEDTPASYDWTIDTIAPDTGFVSRPADPSNVSEASFSFISTEGDSSFECNLDSAGFSVCESPKLYDTLGEGLHTFAVRAIDAAGNPDASPASYSWTVDTIAPDTSITDMPDDPSNRPDGSLSFTSTELNSDFECGLDGGDFTSCTSPFDFAGLEGGTHSFAVRATDSADNTDDTPATYDWTIDLEVPETTITAMPSDPSNSAVGSIEFESSETGSSFECSLDGALFGTCTNPYEYSGLSDGEHTFLVRATDGAGNTDETPASHTWNIDTLAPETTITAMPSDPSNSAAGSFEFESSETGSSFECSLDGAEFGTCTSPYDYSGLSDDEHTFQVRATDGASNTDDSPASYEWAIDTTAPETSLTDVPVDPSSNADGSFGFESNDPSATFECQLDGGEFATCTSPYAYEDLLDGTHTFAVRGVDGLGNTDATPASHEWTIDTFAPDTGILTGPDASTASTSASFEFISNEPGSTLRMPVGQRGIRSLHESTGVHWAE